MKPRTRNHVHLSLDKDTARSVGKRFSKELEPLIFEVEPTDDLTFFISDNNVILVDYVGPEYLSIKE